MNIHTLILTGTVDIQRQQSDIFFILTYDCKILRYPNKHCNVAKDLPKWNVVKLTDTKTDHWCNADKMKKLVATKGAVVATMYASDWSFNQYGGDVYKECS